MPVNIHDLPPRYQAQAMARVLQQEKKTTSSSAGIAIIKNNNATSRGLSDAERRNKYRNNPTARITKTGKVILFASQKEAERYDALMLLLAGGEIKELKLQPEFTLQEAFTDSTGTRIQAIKYRADFSYKKKGKEPNAPKWSFVVEDVKSKPTKTDVYLLKRKLMKERLGLDITEV